MDEFEHKVALAVDSIPVEFSAHIGNLAFIVEVEPDPELLWDMGIEDADELLGLYQGDPLTARGADHWGALPDQIILFKRAIEKESEESGLPVETVIRETILHEVGHYFGLDEEELAEMGLE